MSEVLAQLEKKGGEGLPLDKGKSISFRPTVPNATMVDYQSGVAQSYSNISSMMYLISPRTRNGRLTITSNGGAYLNFFVLKDSVVTKVSNSGAVSSFTDTYSDADLIVVMMASSSGHTYGLTITDN